MKTTCMICGDEFEAAPCNIRSGRAKYCSPSCRFVGQRKTETRPCSQCGTPITRRPSEFHTEFTYCDSACRNKHVATKDRPSVRIEEEFVFIPLSQDQWARVDRSDYDSIPMLRDEIWSATWVESSQTFYAIRRENKSPILMHRVVTSAPDGMDVNHRDHNGLNNSRKNLDVCTRSQNIQYKRKPRQMNGNPTSSRYKGVSADPHGYKWIATINSGYLGHFDSEEEAAEAYNRAAAEKFGHYAKLNEIVSIE